jgi:uncharacterized membrane protein
VVKKAIAVILLLGAFTAIGSVYQLKVVPYMVVASVIVITTLIAIDKIQARHYPMYIFGLALALIWQTSMIGTYFVGVDIHSEYMVVLRTIENGWDVNWGNIGNTSAVLTWLTPFLAKLGFNPIWQFKVLYPFICAFVPVILYFAYKNLFGEKRAYFGALFFMMMPMFTMEAVSMVKTQVAYVFVAGIVWVFTAEMTGWRKAVLVLCFAVGTIMSHYTVGIMTSLFLLGVLLVLAMTNWWKLRDWLGKRTIPIRWLSLAVLLVGVFFYIWFANIGNGGMINQVKSIFGGVYINMSQINLLVETPTYSSTTKVVASDNETVTFETGGIKETITKEELPEKGTEQMVKAWTGDAQDYTQPVRQSTYFDRQPKLVRAAIGMDFIDVSGWGKVFRIFQYLTELMLIVGFVVVFWKRKEYSLTAEYKAGILGCFTLLGSAIFLPYFTVMTVTTTRLYAYTLFYISPLLVLGIERVLLVRK